ncbi:amino acid adenylation domain-containing protein [Brasilonema sp. CT11]|nr:amino acid adenylation domain-containing protein [Brasilonema sp. CT11]
MELWIDGDGLAYRGPQDVLTPELLAQIKQYKQEIIHILSQGTDNAVTYPLSHGQKALWFLYQSAPNSAAYNVSHAVKLVANLDIPALKQATQALVERHPILRTTFTTIDGEPMQMVRQNQQVCFSIQENFNWSQDNVINWISEASTHPFDLEYGSNLRLNLLINHTTIDTLATKEYVLLITLHHIVVDFWSLEIIISELRLLYEAITKGFEPLLPALNFQYRDYVKWSKQMLAGSEGEHLWSYWSKQLSGELPVLNLPTDRPRPAIQTYNGATHFFALDEKLHQNLIELAKKEGVTLYTILLAALQVLLLRYTNQEDILIGSAMVNRSHSEFEKIVGYFANPVVLRTDLSGNPTFQELLKRSRSCVLNALEHQDYPFPLLVERLQPVRDPSYSPLYQVGFAWDRSHQSEETSLMNSDELIVESIIPEVKGAAFDLTLIVLDLPGALKGTWNYNTDLFTPGTIERMALHFVTMLSGIVANPIERISQLPLLTQLEQQQLLVDWNDTHVDYLLDKCIHQLFEEQVERIPDAVAVVFENQQLTYHQLNCRANQLAHYLRSLGVGADGLVGICVERSLEMVVGLLGILKAGGAYVPFDPTYPIERLSFMLEDASVSVLLTQQQLVKNLPKHEAQVVCLDTDWEIISQSIQENCIDSVQASNLAYVIYTSGSTDRPKGVMVEHKGLSNLAQAQIQTFGVECDSRILQFASFSFDASIWEVVMALGSGATLYLGTKDSLLPGQPLIERLRNYSITHITLPPSALAVMPVEELLVLQTIIVAGEACSAELIKQWSVSRNFFNAYGPTEASVCATMTKCTHEDEKISIGKAIANTKVYILDKNLQPVPVGVPGELHIGGVGLARGYLNRPKLTQEKFIPNPFGVGCLYKTGDLAHYLPDGNIEYLGRIDNQVKIRGFRIELGEIEAALSQHKYVQTSCVIAREDNLGDKRLVGYVVAHQYCQLTMDQLRQFLKAKLPEYMVPSAFVILESMPLTPNGKVDRRALKAPDLHSKVKDKYVAPRTPIEELLTQIWAQVLKLEQVGIDDDFFTLGGHSLLATQLVSRIRNIFKVELPLRELFARTTVAEFAQKIQQLQQQSSELSAPAILPREKNAKLPLSFGQQRLWFLEQLQPNSSFYNVPIALRLVGTLSVAALVQSLKEIIARHEALRTNFITVDGQPTQIIREQGIESREQGAGGRKQGTVSIVDLQHLSTFVLSEVEVSKKEIALQQLVRQQVQRPFDLATKPLIRTTLVVLSETEHALLLCMHHIVLDGWSISVFVQELASLYNAYSINQPSLLAPLPIQYADFAIWQRQWLQGNVLQSQLNYWQQQLKDAPTLLSLPTDRPRPSVQSFSGAYQEFALSQKLTSGLTQLSQQQGVTLFMTLLAAFDTLLYRYTGVADIVVGTSIANRDRSEIEGLIGFFVNTLVMRTNLAGNPSFSELLSRVREMAMDAYTHQNLPFEMLVEALQPGRDLSHTPLFQVTFALQNAPISELKLTGLTVSPIKVETTTAKFDLTLSMENTTQGLVGVWEYNTDLFDASTIERIMGHFVILLESIIANPQQQISQLPLLSEVEQRQLLVEWNATQVDYPLDKCIHQLFEAQVERTPNAVAVVFENVQTRTFASLTYHQLNCRANQLAHYLKSLGVGADVLVGICVERSLEMVVGLLGILKAGGAYVPLDPDYPTDRLRFMLEDAQVSVLLTQQRLIDKLPEHQANLHFDSFRLRSRQVAQCKVCLDKVWEKIAQNNQDNPISEVRAFNLANVIYTSGSTGRPKGVMVEHRGLCNLAQAQIQTFGVDSDSRVLQFASFSFDASISEILMALGSGATLYLGTKDSLMPGKPLIEKLRDYSITHITLPPSALAVMPVEELPTLQTMIVAGEACPAELIKQWSVGRNFFNAYGPTEASVCATIGKATPKAIAKCTFDEKISIGKAIANTQVYILDKNLQLVPVGVPGELHISGVGLARGYLNRPQLTLEKFIPNPFSDEPYSRLYKTGDLTRYLSDGSIEFLGRIDHQVKIRGYRIELQEVENVLSQQPGVQKAVVVAREDQPGNKRLVAYVVPQQKNLESLQIAENFSTDKVELWPSVAEYYVYDELLYYAMTNDHRRNDSYKVAINQLVKDKIVVEIGTGKDAILSRFCVEGGAKKIYAIERDEETCRKAIACIEKLGLADKITVIHGDATLVGIPELADVCVSEIVGAIGGSEGATVIINNTRRFLKPNGLMIPERSVTKMAAVTLPEQILHKPNFAETPAHYTKKIFEQVGYPFDLRVCIKNFPQTNVLSTVDVLEDLNFNEYISPEFSHTVKFEIQKNGRIDGFLVWLNLHTITGEEIDILEHEHCWLPVYFPVFEPGIDVEYGDVIQAVCSRTLCENHLNPDYAIKGCLQKKNGENIDFEYVSYHYKNNFCKTPFYQRLFANYINAKNNQSINLNQSLRANLKELLPDYMIPSNFVLVEKLPLTPNGKVDRHALPKPELTLLNKVDNVIPNTELEKIIAGIWQKVLAVENLGIYNNFFELGGHSLLLVKIHQQLQEELDLELSIADMFKYPTIHSFSQYIKNKNHQEDTSKQNNFRRQSSNESKTFRNQQLELRQQYLSHRKGKK